jgi:carboxypeptidase C (cathepsin A)
MLEMLVSLNKYVLDQVMTTTSRSSVSWNSKLSYFQYNFEQLIYASQGQIPWMEHLDTRFQQKFLDSPAKDFRTHNRTAGFVRSTGGSKEAGHVAYVEIFEAGHMAPHDQPDAALDMFNR